MVDIYDFRMRCQKMTAGKTAIRRSIMQKISLFVILLATFSGINRAYVMKRYIIFITTFLLIVINSVFSQEIITVRRGHMIIAKINEISSSEISYKRFERLDGPMFFIPIDCVHSIRRENGSLEIINVRNDKVTVHECIHCIHLFNRINILDSNGQRLTNEDNINEVTFAEDISGEKNRNFSFGFSGDFGFEFTSYKIDFPEPYKGMVEDSMKNSSMNRAGFDFYLDLNYFLVSLGGKLYNYKSEQPSYTVLLTLNLHFFGQAYKVY